MNWDNETQEYIDSEMAEPHKEYLEAVMSLGIPEDEAELFLEDMGL